MPIGLRKHLENFWKNFQKIAHFSKTTHLTKMATMPYKSLLIALYVAKGNLLTIVVLEIWPNLTHFSKFSRIFEKFSKIFFFSDFSKFSLYYVILSIKNSKLTKKSKKNFQKIFRNFQNFSKSFAYRPTKTLRKFLKKFSKNRPFLENDAFDENGNYAI